MLEDEIFLGGDVYCKFDGEQYVLNTINPKNTITLNRMAIHNLIAWDKEVRMVYSGAVPDEHCIDVICLEREIEPSIGS